MLDNFMVDLETMGNGPEAAIISIGVVGMDFENGELGDEFYAVVDLQSSIDNGGKVDPSTISWWMMQSEDARELFKMDGELLPSTLAKLALWLKQRSPKPKIWGHGATFDNVILSSAYKNAGLHRPWSYREDRCYRTIKAMFPGVPEMEQIGTVHNALDDAKHQARHLLHLMAIARGE